MNVKIYNLFNNNVSYNIIISHNNLTLFTL